MNFEADGARNVILAHKYLGALKPSALPTSRTKIQGLLSMGLYRLRVKLLVSSTLLMTFFVKPSMVTAGKT